MDDSRTLLYQEISNHIGNTHNVQWWWKHKKCTHGLLWIIYMYMLNVVVVYYYCSVIIIKISISSIISCILLSLSLSLSSTLSHCLNIHTQKVSHMSFNSCPNIWNNLISWFWSFSYFKLSLPALFFMLSDTFFCFTLVANETIYSFL